MSGFEMLARLGLTVRPLVNRPPEGFTRSQFIAPISKTATTLARELEHLQAERIVLEVDLRERDIRLDGMPRADARPTHPGVALAFDSKHGPLRYATAEFTEWGDNLRGIALAMESLRAVDRYGVSKRGEQYRGWRELTASTDPADTLTTPEQALALLNDFSCPGHTTRDEMLKRAIKAHHPDNGGDPGQFRRVMKAKELLGL